VNADQQSFDMEAFLGNLKTSYQRLLESGGVDSKARDDLRLRLNSLRLAGALYDKIDSNKQQPEHPLQIGILGPTQAGKSTLSNALRRALQFMRRVSGSSARSMLIPYKPF